MQSNIPGAPAAVNIAHQSALRSLNRVVEETTTPTPPDEACARIRSQLVAGNVLIVTGAGVSTGSGIPDYRGPNGSLTRHRPMTYQEFMHDDCALRRYWARSFLGWRYIEQVRPNTTHTTITRWQQQGYLSGVITQNVDGLHQRAGTTHVLNLHGDLATVVCLDCGRTEARFEFDMRMEKINPFFRITHLIDPAEVNPDGDVELAEQWVSDFHLATCLHCDSSRMKPNVVYFGEPVPALHKQRVRELLECSDSVLVLGSSLAVMSGMRIVIDAKKQRKMASTICAGPGRADAKMDVVWRSGLDEALGMLTI